MVETARGPIIPEADVRRYCQMYPTGRRGELGGPFRFDLRNAASVRSGLAAPRVAERRGPKPAANKGFSKVSPCAPCWRVSLVEEGSTRIDVDGSE